MIYDREVCEVHQVKMELKEVPIFYGSFLPIHGGPSGETAHRLFPHHREYLLGGCVITPGSPETNKVYFCSQCKVAYGKWTKENPQGK